MHPGSRVRGYKISTGPSRRALDPVAEGEIPFLRASLPQGRAMRQRLMLRLSLARTVLTGFAVLTALGVGCGGGGGGCGGMQSLPKEPAPWGFPMDQAIEGGKSSTTALKGSTEDEQFFDHKPNKKAAVS